MANVRDLIRQKIQDKGLSMKDLSTNVLGRNHAYLQQFLDRSIPRELDEDARALLAPVLGLDEGQLRERPRQPLQPKSVDKGKLNHQIQVPLTPEASQSPLKVLGMAEGGPDGWSLWNGDVIEWVQRPPNLAGVPDAYAVYVMGSSMEPRYHAGELAYIHPHRPITIGAYVLVQKKPKGPGEPPLAVIKRLAKRSGNRVVLEQFNPAKTFEIKADEIVSIHRVVGSGEA